MNETEELKRLLAMVKEPIPELAKCGCGGDAQILIADPGENEHILFPHFGVSCKKCRVMIGTTVHGLTDFFDTPHEAAEAWNRLRGMKAKRTEEEPEVNKMTETFKHHEFNEDQSNVSDLFRETAEELEAHIVLHCEPSREKSLALTKLEECVMWANKALAIHGVWKDSEGC